MGIVFKARQGGLGRIVALKMLRSLMATREELARFRKEAEMAARLEHPNIVSVHEINEHRGFPYFSLKFVDGVNLADDDRPRSTHATDSGWCGARRGFPPEWRPACRHLRRCCINPLVANGSMYDRLSSLSFTRRNVIGLAPVDSTVRAIPRLVRRCGFGTSKTG